MTNGRDRGPRLEWGELQIVTVEGTDLAVRVQTTLSGRPFYSRELGVMRDGRFLRYVRDDLAVVNGVVTVRAFDDAAAARVQAAATEVIRKHAQAREDEWRKSQRPAPSGNNRPEVRRRGGRRPGRDDDEERWS